MAQGEQSRNRLVVATDKRGLSCTVTILPGLPSDTPEEIEISALLEEQRIAAGAIDRDAIAGLITLAKENPDGEHSAVVARGRPPADGEHARFTLAPALAEQFEEIERRKRDRAEQGGRPPEGAEADGGGAVDFREQSAFVIVRKGDVLGEVTNATSGEDGVDVRGESIPGKAGHSLRLETDHTTRVKGSTMIATVDGRLVHAIDRLKVETTLEIAEDVDYATGHVDFPGSVVVHGSVKDQFRLKATGDIRVEGLVEAADVFAGGDLFLSRGMAGRDAGTLWVAGDLHAGYLDSVSGDIEGDCCIKNEIKESRLTVGRRVESGSCAFYGGEIRAGLRVELATIGGAGGIETGVAIGPCEELDSLVDRIERVIDALGSKREQSATELKALNDAIRKLNATQAERLTELQFEQIQADELSEKVAKAAAELLVVLRKPAPPTLSVRRTLHRGVTVRLRHVEFRVKESVQGPVVIDLDRAGNPRCFVGNSGEASPIGTIATLTRANAEDPLQRLASLVDRFGIITDGAEGGSPPAQAA